MKILDARKNKCIFKRKFWMYLSKIFDLPIGWSFDYCFALP